MKKLIRDPRIIVLSLLALFTSAMLLGADAAPAVPDWIGQVLGFIESIPTVGPVVSFILKLVGVIGTVFTMLTVFLTGTCKTLSTISQLAKLSAFADKVQAFHDRLYPYLAYLSIFNVPKK